MRTSIHSIHSREAGFVTFYALLVIVALLGISSAIATIGIKEFQLSTVGARSQRAQYYAESGMECAVYAVVKYQRSGVHAAVTCGGRVVTTSVATPQPIFFADGGCAVVIISSNTIEARGYDIGSPSTNTCPASNSRVERAFWAQIN